MLLYYITDRGQFPGNETQKRDLLLAKIGEASRCSVQYIQLREKDLSARELESLARQAMGAITAAHSAQGSAKTQLLINSRIDIALAAGAQGVHLRSLDAAPAEIRKIWQRSANRESSATVPSEPLVAVSCHTAEEVACAGKEKANFAVFAPVFEKVVSPERRATGLDGLRQACSYEIPVFALGGVSLANAHLCLEAGAAGIAGIRLFQQNEIERVVALLAR